MKTFSERTAASYTIALIIITFLLRCWLAAYTGLGIGESYYFRGVLHVDLSYFDQPPLFFWLSALSTKIFGLNAFGLRFPALILFAGTSWFMFLLTRKFFTAKAGFWAVLVMNISAVFILIGTWFQPDAPLMFFWMLSAYLISEIMLPGTAGGVQKKLSNRRIYFLWILTGIAMGFATLSKYHVLFLFAGVFLFAVTNKDQRHWLTHPGPYIAVLITFIIALPVLWWNYKNNWASFVFQGSRAGAGGEKFRWHFDWFFRSIGGQSLWLLPWIWFPLILQLIKSYKRRRQSEAYSFCFWLAVLPIIFFTVVTLWADLQYHFHWQAPGYMMLFIPLGFAIDQGLNSIKRKKITRRWLILSTCFTVVVVGVFSVHMVTGFWRSYGPKWIVSLGGGDVDPTMEGMDYNDLKTRFEKEGWLNNNHIFAGSTRWWLNGKVDWALRGKKEIICFNKDSRNISYFVDPNTLIGKDAVVIGNKHEQSVNEDVKPFFDEVIQLPDVEVTRSGITELKLQVYYCKNFHVPSQPYEDYPLYRQLTGRPPFGK